MTPKSSTAVTLAFASVAHTFSHMFVLFFATIVLVLEAEWGLSYAELMALSIPGAVLFGACALPAGWLGDKWSGSAMLAENALLARFAPLSLRGRIYGVKFVLTLGVSAIGVGMIPLVHALLGSLDMLFILLAGVAFVAFVAAMFIPRGKDAVVPEGAD